MPKLTCFIFVICTLTFIGCENSFEPLQVNEELTFSINGVLDVHADTQWVRVMPIGRSLIPADPNENGTAVDLTRQSTGEVIALEDSLFMFGGDTYVWNYWLTEDMNGDESYEIVAESPDGDQSRVVVNTPSPLPVPNVIYSEDFESISVSGIALDTIVVAETRYLAQALTEAGCAPEREIIFSHLDEMNLTSGNEYAINSNNREDIASELGVFADQIRINRREFVVVTAGPDWPEDVGLSDLEKNLPEVISNVEGGTGLVAGIARRKIEILTPLENEKFSDGFDQSP
ncbi:hypothetical protein [Rhodohalobacter sp.]|uniref:hypothetical protein n=1 Tax=Rhodohalobacter sp. TaxID=1974210 RepID=UPI002ACEB367|nr:hypothetical protein [Rhodohalobacter sp.]MDZ7755385.1 hypothetical protein [Rhodohalobacter sp.]